MYVNCAALAIKSSHLVTSFRCPHLENLYSRDTRKTRVDVSLCLSLITSRLKWKWTGGKEMNVFKRDLTSLEKQALLHVADSSLLTLKQISLICKYLACCVFTKRPLRICY